MITIVLDPGHGGPSVPAKVGGSSWNNATGPTGLLEKTVTLQVAKAAAASLAAHPVTVVLTRTTDVNVGIEARAAVAKSRNAEVFVSIHFNAPASDGPPAQGTETWINPSPTPKSKALAKQIQSAVVAVTGRRDRGVKADLLVSGVLRNDFHRPDTAHCLVEISFLGRAPDEEARLRTDTYVEAIGDAIKDAVIAYCVEQKLLAAVEPAMVAAHAVEPEDAASALALGLIASDVLVPTSASVSTMAATAEQRMRMAQLIVDMEARRKNGKLAVYEPPGNDGGGKFEVAGINVRYHPDQAWALRELIEAGRPDEAEALARDYVAQFTDQVASWSTVAAVEYCLRDCAFNRGPRGAAKIVQMALGVTVDGAVGAQTRAAIATAEADPHGFLDRLRTSREDYERDVIGVRENFIKGLISRWDKVRAAADTFLPAAAMPAMLAPIVAEAAGALASYFPHWATGDGTLTRKILDRLAPGTIIGAHHLWEIEELQRILDFPAKKFVISWYSESYTNEDLDEAKGRSVADRIEEARLKQRQLRELGYGAERFANMVELDAAREKKTGGLEDQSRGNAPSDWIKDARLVRDAGFTYLAKSPTSAQVAELRAAFGSGFIPRIVFEDVTAEPGAANPGYRSDARQLAASGEILTLIVHEGLHGEFPGTDRDDAQAIIDQDFASWPRVEAFWGRESDPKGFERLKSFGAGMAPAVAVAVAAPYVQRLGHGDELLEKDRRPLSASPTALPDYHDDFAIVTFAAGSPTEQALWSAGVSSARQSGYSEAVLGPAMAAVGALGVTVDGSGSQIVDEIAVMTMRGELEKPAPILRPSERMRGAVDLGRLGGMSGFAMAAMSAREAYETAPPKRRKLPAGLSGAMLVRGRDAAAIEHLLAMSGRDPAIRVSRVPMRYWLARGPARVSPKRRQRGAAMEAAPASMAAALWHIERTRTLVARQRPGFKEPGNIRVAVLDTGIDDQHPLLQGRIARYLSSYDDPEITAGIAGAADIVGHGTHVTGTIMAAADATTGVRGMCAPELWSFKIFSDREKALPGIGQYGYVVHPLMYRRALLECLDNDIRVVNLSIGGPKEPDEDELGAINALLANNCIVVAAMGNDRQGSSPRSYPAAVPGVIAVGASDMVDHVARFSNYGSHIWLSAPGVGIWSTLPTYAGQTGFRMEAVAGGGYRRGVPISRETTFGGWDGTSMATPQVTAAVAMFLAKYPKATLADVKDKLRQSATKLPMMAGADFHLDFGFGRLDVDALLR